MKIPHVTIHTNKAEEDIAFYKQFAGLSEVRAFGNITFLGNSADETLIEIISGGDSYSGKGISIGFTCSDLDAKKAELEAAGFKTTDFSTPNPNTRFFFTEAPDGVTVQFIN